jgi:hypothetical protein|tara:strand:- start:42 stop:1166 length:1125 start_codon:yes stop_codon:yes gene_type:complete
MENLKFKEELMKNGFAVVPDIIDAEECRTLQDEFWVFFERLSRGKLKRSDKSTWKSIYDFFPNHGMLFQHFSVGHMQAIWDIRQSKGVVKAFKHIWETKDLTVSFDGASFGLMPEVTNRGWQRSGWLHLDQSPHRNDFECVQGWVTALDVGEGDATLTVLEGSHLLHAAFAKEFKLDTDKKYKGDWFKLESKHVDWYRSQGCVQRFVQCPAGSLVLWDSRTVHSGQQPVKGRAKPKNRIVCYVSMMPQKFLSLREREKKKWAALRGRMTTHWAAKHVKLFGKNPRTYGMPLPNTPDRIIPHFNARSAFLAGWENTTTCPLTIKDAEARKKAVYAIIKSQDRIKTERVAGNAKKRKRNSKKSEQALIIKFKSESK